MASEEIFMTEMKTFRSLSDAFVGSVIWSYGTRVECFVGTWCELGLQCGCMRCVLCQCVVREIFTIYAAREQNASLNQFACIYKV